MPFNHKLYSALAGVMLAGIYGPAAAQTSADDQQQDNAQQEQVAGDIIVTAQRRESTVREVPFSIAAFGGEALRNSQVFSPTALT